MHTTGLLNECWDSTLWGPLFSTSSLPPKLYFDTFGLGLALRMLFHKQLVANGVPGLFVATMVSTNCGKYEIEARKKARVK